MARIQKLFDVKDRQKNADDYFQITIDSDDGGLVGYLTNEFQYNVNSNWETLFDLNGKFKILETVATASGKPLFRSGLFTRKYYKGGSYIEFPVEFRIVDWEGQGTVIAAAKFLTKTVLPINVNVEDIEKIGTDVGNTANKAYDSVRNDTQEILDDGGSIGQKAGKVLGLGFKAAEKYADELDKNGVRPVQVSIGKFLNKSLIIENVGVKYSREIGANGPLYGDFNVKFSTREVPNREQVSSMFSNVSRIKINGQ